MSREILPVHKISRHGISSLYASGTSRGAAFKNDGKTYIELKNLSADERVINIPLTRTVLGLSINDLQVTIPGGAHIRVGPFPIREFNNQGNESGLVYINFPSGQENDIYISVYSMKHRYQPSAQDLPTFAWGMYLSGQEWTDTVTFTELVNTLQTLGFTHLVLGKASTHLDELQICQNKGMKVFCIITEDINDGLTDAEIAALVQSYPVVEYLSVRDEPSTDAMITADKIHVTALENTSKLPVGDTFGVYSQVNGIADPVGQQFFAQTLDPGLFVVDNYPITTANVAGNLTRNAFHTDFARVQQIMLIDPTTGLDWRKDTVLLWSILQGHGSPSLRAPSLAEMSRMTWEAIGTGSNGIFWFIWAYTDANNFVFDGISDHVDRQALLQALIERISAFQGKLVYARPQTVPTYVINRFGWCFSLHNTAGEDLLIVINRNVNTSQMMSLESGGPYTNLETGEVINPGDQFSIAAGDAAIFQYTQPDLTQGKLVWDTFTDANNTALTAHVPELGGPWNNISGLAVILQNGAAQVFGGGDLLYTVDPGVMNTTVEAVLSYVATGQSYICLRVQDIDNYIRAGFVDNKLALAKKIAGTVTIIFHDTISRNDGEAQHIKLVQNGNIFQFYCNGILLTTQTITNLATITKCGIFITSTTTARVRNFAVSASA